ncbi:hypothetical protein D3C86_843650 [compost metagenome]
MIEIDGHLLELSRVLGAADARQPLIVLGEPTRIDHPQKGVTGEPIGIPQHLGDVGAHLVRDLAGLVGQDHEGILVDRRLGRRNLGVDGDQGHVVRERELLHGDLTNSHAGLVDADHLTQAERESGNVPA